MASSEFTAKRRRIPGGSADLTKKRIFAAAELVFSRDGFQGATTREIARQATLLAAREEFGLVTRDAVLGEVPPPGMPEKNILRVSSLGMPRKFFWNGKHRTSRATHATLTRT